MEQLAETTVGPLGRQYCFEGRAVDPEAATRARWHLRELCARHGVVAYQVGQLGRTVWFAVQRHDWPARLLAEWIWQWVARGDLEGRISRRPVGLAAVPPPPAARRRGPTATAEVPVLSLTEVVLD